MPEISERTDNDYQFTESRKVPKNSISQNELEGSQLSPYGPYVNHHLNTIGQNDRFRTTERNPLTMSDHQVYDSGALLVSHLNTRIGQPGELALQK